MGFLQMWKRADSEDAATGGVDTIPEWEYPDYIAGLFIVHSFENQERELNKLIDSRRALKKR